MGTFIRAACVLALMLTQQFARRVPGVAKAATEDLKKLTVTNNHYRRFTVAPFPPEVLGILECGGLVPFMKNRLAAEAKGTPA